MLTLLQGVKLYAQSHNAPKIYSAKTTWVSRDHVIMGCPRSPGSGDVIVENFFEKERLNYIKIRHEMDVSDSQ